MLSNQEIEQNKQTFLELINSIERPFDKEKLIKWLNSSDFFLAPASTKYHCSFAGGLCQHSLNVYYSLDALCNTFATELDENGNPKCKYSKDSIIICGLLHDISKANFYEKYNRNVKNEQTGKWEQVEDYRVKDADSRFIYGNHEETAEFMLRTFLPLEVEESIAILYHMGGTGYDSSQTDLSVIYRKYNLPCLLHLADLASTFLLEGNK